MADITVTTDVSQINNLKDALKSLDPVFVKIVDGIVRENSRLQRLLKKAAKDTEENNKILAQAQEAYSAKLEQESAKREKARAREAAAAEKEAKRIAAAVEKKAAAEARAAQVQAGNRADTAFALGKQRYEEEARALEELNRAKQAAASREDVLRQKYDESYRAMVIYRTQIQELNEALSVGVLTQAGYKDRIDQLNQSLADGSIVAGAYTNQASDGMNKFGVAAQQTGYQVSDFIVQVQSGTNPLVAFSQQATQLAGLLYLLPASMQAARIGIGAFSVSMATATAGVTILIPLLAMIAMNFIGSGKESEEASKKVDKQTKAYEGLIAKIEELRLKRQMEASGIQGQDEQVTINEINRLKEEQIALQKEINALSLAASPAGKIEAKDLADKKKALQATLDDRQATLDKLALELQIDDVLKRKAQAVANANKEELSDRQSLIQAHAAQVQLMGQSQNSQRLMALSVQEALDKYAKMRSVVQDASDIAKRITLLGAKKDAEGFNKAIEDALAAGIQFSLVDLSSIVALAARNGWDLAAALTAAYNVAASRNPAAASILTGAGGRPNINPNDMQYRGPVQNAQATILQYNRQQAEDAANAGGGGGRAESRLKKQIDLTKELTQVERERQTVIRSVEGSLEDGFMAMVEGTASVKDAFKKMAYEIIKELYRVLVVQRLVGGISSGIGMLFGKSTGSFGLPFGRASGGSIMPGQSYLVGENGPELVIPRHSGTVVNANQTAGGSGSNGSVTVQNNITVTGSDAAMVRAEVAKMIPQITNATKAAVIDARLRGGQMKAAFS